MVKATQPQRTTNGKRQQRWYRLGTVGTRDEKTTTKGTAKEQHGLKGTLRDVATVMGGE